MVVAELILVSLLGRGLITSPLSYSFAIPVNIVRLIVSERVEGILIHCSLHVGLALSSESVKLNGGLLI